MIWGAESLEQFALLGDGFFGEADSFSMSFGTGFIESEPLHVGDELMAVLAESLEALLFDEHPFDGRIPVHESAWRDDGLDVIGLDVLLRDQSMALRAFVELAGLSCGGVCALPPKGGLDAAVFRTPSGIAKGGHDEGLEPRLGPLPVIPRPVKARPWRWSFLGNFSRCSFFGHQSGRSVIGLPSSSPGMNPPRCQAFNSTTRSSSS